MSFDNFDTIKSLYASVESKDYQQFILKYPFLCYSYSFWGYHASGPVEYLLENEIITFLDTAYYKKVTHIFRPECKEFWQLFNTCFMLPLPSPLQSAVYQGLTHIIDVLLNRGVDTGYKMALGAAVEAKNLEMVKLLLSEDNVNINQIDSNMSYYTPLIIAAGSGYEEIVKIILGSTYINTINSVDENGWSALLHAIYGSHKEVVRILLASPDINVTLYDKYHLSPLAMAVCKDQDDIVEMVLKCDDVDPDIRSSLTQQTPLLYAAEHIYTCHIIEMLLQTDQVDVNSKDCNGRTALMIMASYGKTEAAKILLKHPGIDIMAKDNNSMTAYNHACWPSWENYKLSKLKDDKMITLLKQYGGKLNMPDNYLPIYLTNVYFISNE